MCVGVEVFGLCWWEDVDLNLHVVWCGAVEDSRVEASVESDFWECFSFHCWGMFVDGHAVIVSDGCDGLVFDVDGVVVGECEELVSYVEYEVGQNAEGDNVCGLHFDCIRGRNFCSQKISRRVNGRSIGGYVLFVHDGVISEWKDEEEGQGEEVY